MQQQRCLTFSHVLDKRKKKIAKESYKRVHRAQSAGLSNETTICKQTSYVSQV